MKYYLKLIGFMVLAFGVGDAVLETSSLPLWRDVVGTMAIWFGGAGFGMTLWRGK